MFACWPQNKYKKEKLISITVQVLGMGKAYFKRDTEPTKFKIKQIFDLAGRIILHGIVLHKTIKPGIEGKVGNKRFILEHIEQKNRRIDHLDEGETGDLIIKSKNTLNKIVKDDFKQGQTLIF